MQIDSNNLLNHLIPLNFVNFFMKIILAHDSFTQMGGAERVVDDLHELFPEAVVFTLVFDKKFKEKYRHWKIETSFLQNFYNFFPYFFYFLPFIPLAVYFLGKKIQKKSVEPFLLLTSSSGLVKNLQVPSGSVHVLYCHTPPRFLHTDKEYVEQETPAILKPFAKLFLKWMRRWDQKNTRADYIIANSEEVKKRIKNIYDKDSKVIYPSIHTGFWHPVSDKKDYFLLAGRLHAYKKNELIVETFTELGLPLHVVGSGRQERYLKSISGKNVKFLGRVTDEILREEYSGALAYIFPQIEDFGLMPLEAAGCGTATLAYGFGGSLETIKPGVTGELFYSYDKEQIKNLVLNWKVEKYSQDALRHHAESFGKGRFNQAVIEFVSTLTR